MTALSEMPVRQAASKAIEVLLYGEYLRMLEPSKYYQFKGTFEEYLDQEYSSEHISGEESVQYDTRRLWEHMKYEGADSRLDGLTAKIEAQYGGEGQGDNFWLVISVSDGLTTRYFRRDGWYASYDGGYLDSDTFEVKPQEKVVTFYE